MSEARGILAIWNDCARGEEALYERWYRREHLAERVGVEGFLAGWRYAALEARSGYFTYYETRDAGVLRSRRYRERLDDPTPLTRRIMSGVLVNMSRTVCERRRAFGASRGACASVARFDAPVVIEMLDDAIAALANDEAVLRAQLWAADADGDAHRSTEQALRGSDATIAACVVLETASEADAWAASERMMGELSGAPEVGVYRLMCSLHRDGLSRDEPSREDPA